jgi:hypothetical protein
LIATTELFAVRNLKKWLSERALSVTNWVHVAIDRFTGQRIDKRIEVVDE